METPNDKNKSENRSDRWPNDFKSRYEADKLNPDNPGDRYIQQETRDRNDAADYSDDFYGLREIDTPTGFTSVDKSHYFAENTDPESNDSDDARQDLHRYSEPDELTRFASPHRNPDPEEFF